jgi:putative beta-barrel porin
MRYLFLSVAAFLFLISSSTAQIPDGDSLVPATREPLKNYSLSAGSPNLIIDSASFNLQDPLFYDKALRNQVYIQQTGNFGSAINDIFTPIQSFDIIAPGFNQYNRSMLFAENNKIELPALRFTNLEYHLASKKEQHIFVTHNQKFRPWLVAGLKFGAQISPGEFTGQEKNILNFNIYSLISTKSEVYNIYLSYTSNRVLNDENGGIISDSAFIDASKLETKTVPVNLDNAFAKNKTREYFARQELMPFKNSSNSVMPKIGLRHRFRWFRQSVLFSSESPNPGYFTDFYFDSVSTFDSSFVNSISNSGELFYRSTVSNIESLASLGIDYQVVDYYTGGTELNLNTSSVIASLYRKSDVVSAGIDVKIGLHGYGSGSTLLRLNASAKSVKGYKFYADVSYRKARPNLRELLYISNHFIWDNRQFDKETKLSYKFIFDIPGYHSKLTVNGVLNKNFIYYQTDRLPQVYKEYAGAAELRLNNFAYWGRLGIESGVSFFSSSNDDVIPVPAFAFREQLYFRSLLFRGAVNFRSGFILRYNSRYYANNFMPATGVFYVQNDTKAGGYLYVDYFLKFGIKSTTLFIMLEHLNSGFSERDYFMTPNYPMPGRAFKFGFSWNFYD